VPPSSADGVGDENVSGEGSNQLITFDGKWALHRLKSFFYTHALNSEVKPKPAVKADTEEKVQETVKTEL